MKQIVPILLIATCAALASAQTPTAPAATPAKQATTTAKPASAPVQKPKPEAYHDLDPGKVGFTIAATMDNLYSGFDASGQRFTGGDIKELRIVDISAASAEGNEYPIPLKSNSMSGGKILTKDFGIFLVRAAGNANANMAVKITDSQIKQIQSFLKAKRRGATGTAKPATAASKPATASVKPSTTGTKPAVPAWVKLPKGVPPARGIVKMPFSLHYQDVKIGTGAEAEPNKLYKVLYTGYLGANGRDDDGKFDSSEDHRQPVMGKDGKPEMGDDGKPKLGDPQPITFPQGMGRLIPGFDQGFEGMKIGGRRRIFIPWQLAYGARGRPGPDAAHPGIPPKADLIFDVELVDVTDLPTPPNRPGMMPGMRPMPPRPGATPGSPTAPAPSAPGAQTAPKAPAAAPVAPATPAPPTAQSPPTTPAPPAPQTQPTPPAPPQTK